MNERILAGRYRVLEAVGGRSDLFHAMDESLCRKVAVMRLAENVTPETRLAWEQEIAKAAGMHDPHLLSIYDVVIEEPDLYLITEDLEGTILARWMRDRAPLKPELAVDMMHQLVGAVVAAERAGVSDMAITPTHVLVTKEGFLKVIGYGPLLGHNERGRSQTELLHASGVLLYEMLTGDPYSDFLPTQQVREDVRNALNRYRASDHLWLPERLLTIIERILAKSAFGPFESVQELYKEVKGIHQAMNEPLLSRVESKAKQAAEAGVGSTQALGRMKDSVMSVKDLAQGSLQKVAQLRQAEVAKKMAEETMKPKRSPVTYLAAVLALLVVTVGIWWTFGSESSTATTTLGQSEGSKTIKMPNLLNKTEEQAVQILSENGYPTDRIQWVYRPADDQVTKGKVYRQSADPNTQFVTSDMLVLTVNSDASAQPGSTGGKGGSSTPTTKPMPNTPEGIVPNLTGLTRADAEQALLQAGYRYSFQIEGTSTPSGTVGQQTPAAGTKLAKGERVTFSVSP
ncbi:PASTA domain-containing protein [Tumebacillus permanentifrigoris]|uniref:PASTA domain-containing protein n=1 Tax=Tumebacillus permanentifrigoris TaxID=378543 RepID=A0A316DR71_9BACL|nr:PASTA domain-containing protein [Tumebacillus permanentifrigoris]PWK06946.1 PASTA domain-containing protein [Tumebacillus permanentifrigoris]